MKKKFLLLFLLILIPFTTKAKILFEDIEYLEHLSSLTLKHRGMKCPEPSKQNDSFNCTIFGEKFFDKPVTKKVTFLNQKAIGVTISFNEYDEFDFFSSVLSGIFDSPPWSLISVGSPHSVSEMDIVAEINNDSEKWYSKYDKFSQDALALGQVILLFTDQPFIEGARNSQEFLDQLPEDFRIMTIIINSQRKKIDITIQMPSQQLNSDSPRINVNTKGRVF